MRTTWRRLSRSWAIGTKKIERAFRTKRETQDWLTAQRSSVLTGTHVDPRRGERPFREVADAWRETWVDLEPKTRAGYEAILSKHLLPTFGRDCR